MKVKGYHPSRKCATYIKKMISRGNWKVNCPISPTKSIASTLGISIATVRNVLKQFERQGILDCWGRLGFYLVSNPSSKGRYNRKFLSIIDTNIKAFNLIGKNCIRKRNWLVKFDKDSKTIVGLNEITGVTIESSLKEILNLTSELISLSTVLSIDNPNEFKKCKEKFERQRNIIPLEKIVVQHKKELGINE